MAMASTVATLDHTVATKARSGVRVFKISGSLYHLLPNSLHVPQGETPRFAQFYIYDSRDATEGRLQWNPGLQQLQGVLFDLHEFMLANNPLAQTFVRVGEVAQQEGHGNVRLQFIVDPSRDKRRYNKPATADIAAIVPGDEAIGERGLAVYTSRAPGQYKTQYISPLCALSDPLAYPLLFPFGNWGWSPNVPLQKTGVRRTKQNGTDDKVSCSAFYKYLMHIRGPSPNAFSRHHHPGAMAFAELSQQFVVDVYCKDGAMKTGIHPAQSAKVSPRATEGSQRPPPAGRGCAERRHSSCPQVIRVVAVVRNIVFKELLT
jgi:hypothetical protein